MTIYRELYWPISQGNEVCQTQNLAAPGPLVINGTLVSPFIPGQASFINQGYVRTVRYHSPHNLAGVQITTNGMQNGQAVTERIFGPNNSDVETTVAFDTVTSITIDTAVNDITVGIGSLGYFPLIGIDTLMNTGMLNYALQIVIQNNANEVRYEVYNTLANVFNNGVSYDELITDTTYFNIYQAEVFTSSLIRDNLVQRYLLVKISTTNIISDDIRLMYLQIQ